MRQQLLLARDVVREAATGEYDAARGTDFYVALWTVNDGTGDAAADVLIATDKSYQRGVEPNFHVAVER